MPPINPEAEQLNQTIKSQSDTVFGLLSKKGSAIYFPKKGILSQGAEAKGKKINATIGIALENDGSSMSLQSLKNQINISAEDAFPYAPSFGRPDIREKWRQMIYDKNPGLQGKEIGLSVVTSALTHGLNMVAYLFADSHDKIIIPDLYWENYELIFGNAYGAKLVFFKLFKNNKFDIASLKSKLSSGTGKKILLLNFPNNPAGYTPSISEMQEIVKIIKESAESGNKIVVIVDDAYFGLVYKDGVEKQSIFTWLCDLHENVLAVKVDGPTKEDYVWGFRVGFITYGIKNGTKELYSALEAKTAGAIRGNISNSSNLSQSLLLKTYNSENYESEKKEKYEILKSRYDKVKNILNDKKFQKFFRPLPYNSGYFMCISLKKGLDAEKVRQLLLSKYDTGVITVGNLLRIAFSATKEADIAELFENIYSACNELNNIN
ncbi:MAG: aminotransferase class I/II-fold pyridoxal phosphate-dependent enzyme [Patescibacteria group bacterium]|jgi:aspartate/methionine/tyrosine aminotransferase